MTLLRQNSELRRDRIWNWTLPASTTVLPDGRRINVCPAADGCINLCYARTNAYMFPAVKAAHQRNLTMVLDDLPGWEAAMIAELQAKRFRPTGIARFPELLGTLELDSWAYEWAADGGAAIRIHDSGDFFSDDYTLAWLRIANITPDVMFYAYTKEIPRFRQLVEPDAPVNFRWVYSLGGKHDHLLDFDSDRHADVFPDMQSLADAGYVDQTRSDLLSVLAPTTRIGIPANNIPKYRRRQGNATFGSIQQQRHRARTQRK